MKQQSTTHALREASTSVMGVVLQRKCACGSHTIVGGECKLCQKEKSSIVLQRASATNEHVDEIPPIVHEVLHSPGQPLDASTRAFMEPRFGHDFSQVRVHSDAKAAESAQSVNAVAYTVGRDLVFAEGQYSPRVTASRQLLAHELTHVVQQAGRPFDPGMVLRLDDPTANLESEAASNAKQALTNSKFVATRGNPGGGIQRLQRQAGTGADYTRPTGFPAIDSMSGALTLDGFASDSAEPTAAHRKAVSDYKTRITQLLKQYPDSFITVAGHTDATDTEEHNRVLGQQRAEAVMAVLGEGESAIPTAIMHAYSLGKTQLIVETKEREPRNRRVEVSFMARSFSFRKPLPFTATPMLPRGSGYVMPEKPPPIPAPPPKPEFFKPIPPAPKGTEPRSVLDLVNEAIVDPVVKAVTQWLPKNVQKEIVDLAHDAVEKGVTAGLEAALKDSRLTGKDRGDIMKAVEKAIKLKDKPLDRKPEGEGSPWRQETEPSHVPEKPDDSQWK